MYVNINDKQFYVADYYKHEVIYAWVVINWYSKDTGLNGYVLV